MKNKVNVKAAGAAGIGTAAVLGAFVFSQTSLEHLKPTCPQLQEVAHEALMITPTDFAIVDGLRSLEEHQRNLANGRSWIGRSKHMDGLAIDFIAFVDGKKTWAEGKEEEVYRPIVDAFKQAAKNTGHEIIAGADWNVRDYGHIELKGKCEWPRVADD